MLRITTIQEDEKNIKVRLYGQFTGEYIAEVERTLTNDGETVQRWIQQELHCRPTEGEPQNCASNHE